MIFKIFRNEHEKVEFVIQVVRDVKNITWTLEKRFVFYHSINETYYRVLTNSINRLEHSMHESLKSRSLFCNLVLTMFARVIANYAFRDYSIMKELLKIKSSKNEMYHLRQNESVLNKSFFHVIFIDEMKKIDIFSKRLRELDIRARYLRCSTIHDFRAKNLYLVNIFLSFSSFI